MVKSNGTPQLWWGQKRCARVCQLIPMANSAMIPAYHYTPIYNRSQDESKSPEIVGWYLSGNLQGWLPYHEPPRVIDHYMLQYYDAKITHKSMTLHWEEHYEKEVVRRWGRNIGVSVVL